MTTAHKLITVNGKRWYYRFAPLSQVLDVKPNVGVWHLWDDRREYCGNFPSERALIQELNLCTEKGD